MVMVFFLLVETKFWLQALKKDYMQKCFDVEAGFFFLAALAAL